MKMTPLTIIQALMDGKSISKPVRMFADERVRVTPVFNKIGGVIIHVRVDGEPEEKYTNAGGDTWAELMLGPNYWTIDD